MNTTFKKMRTIVVPLSLAILPGLASASVIGFLGNFDVINDTGSTAHGFEIELEGLHGSDITDTFGGAGRGFPSGRGYDPGTAVVRYGAPTISEYNNGGTSFGTRVTYSGLWNGSGWDFGTPSGSFITPGDNCWTGGGVGYGALTPCDHFGVGTIKNPTNTKYSWLLETGTPGTLTNGTVSLPAPVWDVIPAPVPAPGDPVAPPVVGVQVQAPAPEVVEGEPQFGEALWVKVFTTELENDVELEDLIGGNPVIDGVRDGTHTEVEWQLLQTDPGNPEAGKLEAGYGAPIGPNAASIIRRYEFYKYAGNYDPTSHEAQLLFSDSHPNEDPLAGILEIGNYIGAQNAAANLQIVDPVPVPPAFVLMGSALLGFAANRRARLKKS